MHWLTPVLLFSNLHEAIVGCFDPQNFYSSFNNKKYFLKWPNRYYGYKNITGATTPAVILFSELTSLFWDALILEVLC